MPSYTFRRAFTITELLVVIGVIVVLAGVLLAALAAVRGTGEMTNSMNRMRQIGVWMGAYSADNRDTILPSQFDYSENPYPGSVRTGNLTMGDEHVGSWADILWSVNEIGVLGNKQGDGPLPAGTPTWRHDSPDQAFYDLRPGWDDNPLRAAAPNSTNTVITNSACQELPTPFGCGAQESGLPGYFAANNFFDSRPGTEIDEDGNPRKLWYSNGQIARPNQSMYLVDSYAGEVIDDLPEPFYNIPLDDPNEVTLQVDFRYNSLCLMLFLDGHVDPVNPWNELHDLEGCLDTNGDVQKGREIRVRLLDTRNRPACPP